MRKLVIVVIIILATISAIAANKWILVGGERYLNISNVVQLTVEVYTFWGTSYGVYLIYSLDGTSPSMNKIGEQGVGALILASFGEQAASDSKDMIAPIKKSPTTQATPEEQAKDAASFLRRVIYDFIRASEDFLLEISSCENSFVIVIDGLLKEYE